MRIVPVLAIALLAACSKQVAVERGLVSAGVSATTANCMSREMAKRLSVDQLQKLSRATSGTDKSLEQMSIDDYIAAAGRVGDPQVVLVTAGSAAYCKING